jgi:hypothetical protein
MQIRSAMAPINISLAIGIPVVIAAGHTVASQQYGVKSYDPLILGSAIRVLAISAALAAAVSARSSRVALPHELQAVSPAIPQFDPMHVSREH